MRVLGRGLTCWLLLVPVMLALLAWPQGRGFLSQAMIETAGRAVLAAAGTTGGGSLYPPLPVLLTAVVQTAGAPLGLSALWAPALASAMLGALVLLSWYKELVRPGSGAGGQGYGPSAALAILALLALNPLLPRALAEGPGAMLLLLGATLVAQALARLRLDDSAPGMMQLGAALLLLVLSHPMGMVLALAALPFVALAARPSSLAVAPWGYLTAVYFPALAALLSLGFVQAVLGTDLWPARALAGTSGPEAALIALAAGLLALAALLPLWRLPRYAMPVLALLGAALSACLFNAVLRAEPDPAIAALPMLAVTALAARRWPPSARRVPLVLLLLALTLPLTALALRAHGGAESRAWIAAALPGAEAPGDPLAGDREAAALVAGRGALLVDTANAPGLVALLGSAEGLLLPGSPERDLALLSGRSGGVISLMRREAGPSISGGWPLPVDPVGAALSRQLHSPPLDGKSMQNAGNWQIITFDRAETPR